MQIFKFLRHHCKLSFFPSLLPPRACSQAIKWIWGLVSVWSVDVSFTNMMNITKLHAVDNFILQVQLVETVLSNKVQYSSADL